MIKAVLDTNILISSLFWRGYPRRVVDLAIANKIISITSLEILEEVRSVLADFSPPVSYQRIQDIIRDILSYSHVIKIKNMEVKGLRDLKDVKIVACAVAAEADYIVTGDQDLLVLEHYEKIQIVKSKIFFGLIE